MKMQSSPGDNLQNVQGNSTIEAQVNSVKKSTTLLPKIQNNKIMIIKKIWPFALILLFVHTPYHSIGSDFTYKEQKEIEKAAALLEKADRSKSVKEIERYNSNGSNDDSRNNFLIVLAVTMIALALRKRNITKKQIHDENLRNKSIEENERNEIISKAVSLGFSIENSVKKCKFCAESIKLEAVFCKFCKNKIDEETKKNDIFKKAKDYLAENNRE